MTTSVRHEDSVLAARAFAPAASLVEPVAVGLNVAIIAMHDDEPAVAVVPTANGERHGDGTLPCGPFLPDQHDTLEGSLRVWAERQTGIRLRNLRQLGAYGRREAGMRAPGPTSLVVCYLALVGPAHASAGDTASWHSWYAYLPWEDWRRGKPDCLKEIESRLSAWARLDAPHSEARAPLDVVDRGQRLRLLFGFDGAAWDEEKVLDRYDLLCEAGLIGDGASTTTLAHLPRLRHAVYGDHTRLLASAIGELRRCIKWQPVIFELMADTFTLFELQKAVEAILGPHLHKQNFRRLVETGGLVEPTGEQRFRTGGRPARLYRFRRDVLLERLAPGVRVKATRG